MLICYVIWIMIQIISVFVVLSIQYPIYICILKIKPNTDAILSLSDPNSICLHPDIHTSLTD